MSAAAARKIQSIHDKEVAEKADNKVHEHGADPLHANHKEAQVKKAPVAHGHSGKPAAGGAKPAEGDKAAAPAAAKPAEKKK